MTEQGIKFHKIEDILAQNTPTIVPDSNASAEFYIYHTYGVHWISLKTWLDPLCQKLYATPSNATSFNTERIHSELEWIVKCTTVDPIIGLTLIEDVYLLSALLVFSKEGKLFGSEIVSSFCREHGAELPFNTGKAQVDKIVISENGPEKPLNYQSLLTSKPFTLPKVFAEEVQFRLKAKLNLKKQDQSTDSLIMKSLANNVSILRNEIRDFVLAGNEVQERLAIQLRETQRQANLLIQLQRSISNHTTAGEEGSRPSRRLATIIEQQSLLLSKSDQILQRLLDKNQKEINGVEQQWFDELNKMSKELKMTPWGSVQRSLRSKFEQVSFSVP